MTALWTREELEAATGGRLTGEGRAIGGASIDTRTLRPGDLFFAIRGEARDGHDFVADALGRGAGAAVVAESRASDLAAHGPILAVPEAGTDPVLTAMARVGAAARARTDAQVVAVTGSVGKTGTKEALRHVLSEQGETHASAASYNNHWGVPLTLARMPASARYGVFEIGMNHGAEIVPLTAQVRPDIALITTVEPVHIEHFASLAAIADAKGEIFSGLKPGGVAIINRDAQHFDRLVAHAQASPAGRVVSFGEHPQADVRALKILLRPDLSVVDAVVMGQPVTYKLGTAGRHAALNSLGVMAVVHALGADLAQAALSLAGLTPPVGRGERTALEIGGGTAYLVDESYNANPASVRAALAPDRGAGRHAGARRRLGGSASRPRRGDRGRPDRPRLRRRPPDAPPVRGPAGEPPRRRGRYRRRADRAARTDPAPRRRRDGQGLERQPHGPDCRGAESPLRGRPDAARPRHSPVTGRPARPSTVCAAPETQA
jgi:UDP-N-acetylmuramoyl-tripeptide--D-alanyl-D-alanine ligase